MNEFRLQAGCSSARRSLAGVWAVFLLCLCVPASVMGQSAGVSWLYDVELPVEDRTEQQRRRAEAKALATVLQRLTGLTELPEAESLGEAFADVQRFYSSYSYVARDEAQLHLTLRFDAPAVNELIEASDLPRWSLRRPTLVVWLVRSSGLDRQLLGAASEDALISAMQDRARARGLPLVVPVLDFEEQLAVDTAAVWGGFVEELWPASRRYEADIVVAGRVLAEGLSMLQADLTIADADSVDQLAVSELDDVALGTRIADRLTDDMVKRFAVSNAPDQASQSLRVLVQGVEDLADYAAVGDLLNSVIAIQGAMLEQAQGDVLTFRVSSVAAPKQLSTLLTLGGNLEVVPVFAPREDELVLRWRGIARQGTTVRQEQQAPAGSQSR